MGFNSNYDRLEQEFRQQVEADKWLPIKGIEQSHFLENIRPTGPVDFVLIAMEPSLGGKTSGGETRPNPTHWPKNFSGSFDDFILHHSIRKHLCRPNKTYYLTDIAKGAMPTSVAAVKSEERYEGWVGLLIKELDLVAKPDARLVSIGRITGRFLNEHLNQKWQRRLLGTILHYSATASRWRNRIPEERPQEYGECQGTVATDDILNTAQEVMQQAGIDAVRAEEKLAALRSGSGLTESRRQLIFTYKTQFGEIRRRGIRRIR